MEKLKRMLPTILMIVIEIAVGIMLLIDYERFTKGALIVFGAVLILCSAVLLFRYLKERRAAEKAVDDAQKRAQKSKKESDKVAAESIEPKKVSPVLLIAAIVTFLFGAPFAFGAAYLMELGKLLVVFYGAIMIVKGLFKISDYFSLRKSGAAVSVLRLVIGILSIALGLVLIIFNSEALQTVFVITAISLLVEAALDIVALFLGKKASKTVVIEAKVVKGEKGKKSKKGQEEEDDKYEDRYDLDNFS